MKKQILVAALAVIGSSAFLSPAAQSYDRDDYWHHNVVPYGYNNGYNNYGYYNRGFNDYGDNRRGFIREIRRERREAMRDEALRNERRALRHWDNRLNRWF